MPEPVTPAVAEAPHPRRWYTTNLTYVGAPAPQCEPEVARFYNVVNNVPAATATT